MRARECFQKENKDNPGNCRYLDTWENARTNYEAINFLVLKKAKTSVWLAAQSHSEPLGPAYSFSAGSAMSC